MSKEIIKRVINRVIKRITKHNRMIPKWYSYKSIVDTDSVINLFVPAKQNTMFHEMSIGIFDKFIYDELRRLELPKSPVIWDVGSHIGYHSLNFGLLVGAHGKVLAFEPNPYNRERLALNLKKNVTLSPRIIVYDCALSDSDGEAVFSLTSNVDSGESSGGFISALRPPLGFLSYRNFCKVPVTTKTGDSIVNENPSLIPDLIKIDVEGAECLVLRGMSNILEKKHPLLFIEIHTILMMHYVSELLRKMGYEIEIIDEDNATSSRCFIVAEKKD